MKRVKSRQIKVGSLKIGGDAPISVQSMTNTKTHDIDKTVSQIKKLELAGCELVRVAVPDKKAVAALSHIKELIKIPLVADIHFNYKLALAALDAGADKIRINPGNIGNESRVREIIEKAREKRIPIRIGVNAGSLHKKYRDSGESLAKSLANSALEYVGFFEDLDFLDFIVSVKASSVTATIEAYELLASKVNCPLHIGVTEAGTLVTGTVKSAIGIGTLLREGIGDTIRVSLTANPIKEVEVGFKILRALELRCVGPEIISCPTCGRCEIDLIALTKKVEKKLSKCKIPLKIAVMGCIVNGPGEAREADLGIAAGKGEGLLFAKGKPIKKVPEGDLVEALLTLVSEFERG
ncbi:flavodoxin-dependent (E)-4-hydroxy-3-methylbut-2-enyl-diphosphate synthase [Candidatus Oleimmundimicrobium sp.]|uniref:flavodoxin-dependent (E)-4-hydroxy-3-methylbut-2-enyl-diphosphate synthase n=1 Tax=Candidatus Oleimmundimicrobium sp. TaxID=3060597 RepID=UPI002715F4D2|nr:flavodoxin-dependent (E)-4-hydroxy-3-methylbut-2-enyl-diphosphate synthase [Candidatus Oleimmundimicrobium sp.]MDO8885455.1 flavodoxin-dependent (E)-4-hydroxy-3-methylbut-2-enyl-diphosphate synthase [Candidatus Oleimmundimicrobium sp.]